MSICLQLLANGEDNNENLEKGGMKNGCSINIKGSHYSHPEATERRSLSKEKRVKQLYPDLMRSALYYYPSWQQAVEESKTG